AVLVEESEAAVHLGQVDATLGSDARFTGFALLLGGGIVRHEASVRVAGEGAECRLDGAFIVDGAMEANIVTIVDHQAARVRTRGIAEDEARHMLVEGFLREPVDGIDDPALRAYLLRRLTRRLGTLEG